MEQHHQRNRRERIPRGLNVAVFQQSLVFQKLHRRAGDVRINRAEFADKFFLRRALPDIFLRINLDQKFPVHADEAMMQRRRQIVHPQRRAVVLPLQQLKRVVQIGEQRLLKQREFFRVVGQGQFIAPQRGLPQIHNRFPQRENLFRQCRVGAANLHERVAEIAVQTVKRAAQGIHIHRVQIGRAEFQRGDLLLDFADEL